MDPALQSLAVRYHGKEQVSNPKSQRSIYQRGFRMIYANPVPVAAACHMGKEVVEDALRTIFLAIQDLIKFDHNISLQFGFAQVSFIDKNMRVTFAPYLTSEVKDKDFETTMRRSNSPVGQTWRTNTMSQFWSSNMGTMIKKPNQEVNEALNQKTEALRWMSMDMSSAAKMTK